MKYNCIVMNKGNRSLTLIELLSALVIFSLVVVGLGGVFVLSYREIIAAERMAVVQQEASLIVDHMTKNISQAIGSAATGAVYDAPPYLGIELSGNDSIRVRLDSDGDGRPLDNANWIAYRLNGTEVRYSTNYNRPGTGWPVGGGEILSNRITQFEVALISQTNYITLIVIARYNPAAAAGRMNPQVTMQADINMPMISCR